LRHLVRVACAGSVGGSVRLTAPDPSASLAARVAPLDVPPWPCAGSPSGLALIVLRRLAPNGPIDTQRLMEMFGLTRAEAAILPALLAGDTTEAVASGLGLSSHTVRSHVRAVLAKTQAANLRALAVLVSAVMAG
jgi:DNA-binding CsgD family transcriptional regulator